MEPRDRQFEEKVMEVARVSRTVKGGKRISFRALVIVGDRKGQVGIGIGKANDVSMAIRKAVTAGKKRFQRIELNEAGSIKRETLSTFGSAKVLLRPAPVGTSIISGGVVRTIAELSGVKNLVSKSIGSSNKINLAKATLAGLVEATNEK